MEKKSNKNEINAIQIPVDCKNFDRLFIRYITKEGINEFLFNELIFFSYFGELVDKISLDESEKIIEKLDNILINIDYKSANICSLCTFLDEKTFQSFDYKNDDDNDENFSEYRYKTLDENFSKHRYNTLIDYLFHTNELTIEDEFKYYLCNQFY